MNNKNQNTSPEIVTAAILVIGDEILSGRTKDANVNYIAKHLTEIGIRLEEVRVIGDVEELIVGALNALRAEHDYVFTTGGIGPTHDDITAQSVARALGRELILDERAVEMMKNRYGDNDLTEARLRMARIPEGADLVENTISFAPGFMVDDVIVMAGVPAIMQVMLDAVTPQLRVGRKMHSVTITVDNPESTVSRQLGDLQEIYTTVSMGSYPFFQNGKLGTQLVLRSTSIDDLNKAKNDLNNCLNELGLVTKLI